MLFSAFGNAAKVYTKGGSGPDGVNYLLCIGDASRKIRWKIVKHHWFVIHMRTCTCGYNGSHAITLLVMGAHCCENGD